MIDRLLKYLLCAFFLVVPLSSWKVKFHGIPVSADFILAALVIFLYLIKLVFMKNRKYTFERLKDSIISNKFWLFTVIYVIICLLSFTQSVSLSASINELMRFLSYIFLFYIIVSEPKDSKFVYSLLACFLAACFIVAVFGIIQEFTAIGLDPIFNVEQYFGVSRRIASTMYNPNNLASFIMLVSYPILLTALYIKNKRIRVFLFILFGLMTINLALTFSREGWLGFVIGMIVLAIIYNKKVLYFLAVLPLSLLITSIRERLLSSFNFNIDYNLSRIKLWKTGLMMIKDYPILGVGLGNSIYRYDEYVKRYPDLEAGFTMYPLHNSYIKIEAETGIFGILSFLAMIFYILSKTLKIHKIAQNPILKGISGGLFISAIGYLFMNFFDNCFFDPQTAVFFWLIFALVISLSKIDNKAAVHN